MVNLSLAAGMISLAAEMISLAATTNAFSGGGPSNMLICKLSLSAAQICCSTSQVHFMLYTKQSAQHHQSTNYLCLHPWYLVVE
jgi:hypothetical protein